MDEDNVSQMVFRLMAATTPSGMPTTIETMSDAIPILTVAGNLSTIWSLTARLV